MPKIIEQKLIQEFKAKRFFTREELFRFYILFEPELKEGTFGWRIYDLKNRNIIKPIKKGFYEISNNAIYNPAISPRMLKIIKQLSEKYEDVKHSVWDTIWLNEFMQHQITKSTILIEVEKGFEESFFYNLRETLNRDIFLNPDEKAIDFYVAESKQPVIIKKLISRAPLTKRNERKISYLTPTLEKILVDVFAEERLFHYLQGGELIHIYENALKKYSINFTKLFNYAKRRERDKEIKQFLFNHMFHLVKNLIND